MITSTDQQQHIGPRVRVLLAMTMSHVRSLLVCGTQTGHSYRLVTCDLCLLATLCYVKWAIKSHLNAILLTSLLCWQTMWLLLLLTGLGLSSPLPRADSADLVLVAGDGEMSDLMRAAMTMMEDRADRDVELVSRYIHFNFTLHAEILVFQELKTPRSRSFSRRIKRRPSISRSLTVSSSSSEAGQRPRVQFIQRRVSNG